MKTWYRNLGAFIEVLEDAGELRRISAPVSPYLEITEITDRESKSPGGGAALLFESVEGSAYPVITNAFGSRKRLGLALGSQDIRDLEARIGRLLSMPMPSSFLDKVAMVPEAAALTRALPRMSSGRAPSQEVILRGDDIDLTRLPVLTCWPQDGGPFITLPVVITKGLHDGKRNVGMYRMQVFDKTTTGMHWHIHKDGKHHCNEYAAAGERMPVAVAIGTDPATTYAATAPMPRDLDELLLAGFIRQKPVPLVRGITVDIAVPAEAEFILEGYVDPAETRLEGPFGDHTGYYSLADQYPVFHVTALTHRRNPVYSATVVGRPPMEDYYLGLATERIFLHPLKAVMPEILDYWMPVEGVFHNIVIAAIQKEYPQHARKVVSGLWGNNQMSFSKVIVVIDDAALLADPDALRVKLQDTLDLATDIIPGEGVLDVLDHSAPAALFGAKLGIDATARTAGEPPRRASRFTGSVDAALAAVTTLDPDITGARAIGKTTRNPVILLTVKKSPQRPSSYFTDKIAAAPAVRDAGIAVLFDDGVPLDDSRQVLWRAFNNTDPARDIIVGGAVIVDATAKHAYDGYEREWPDEIVMDPEIVMRVSTRSDELGIKMDSRKA